MITELRPRLSAQAVAPKDLSAALMALGRTISENSSLEEKLQALVALRASQMNGCAFCTVLHAADARDAGETQQRLDALAVWRDTPWFTERERIALEWTERATDLMNSEFDDGFYEAALAEFGERGLVDLAATVGIINIWNRLNVPFRTPPNPQFRSKMAYASAQ